MGVSLFPILALVVLMALVAAGFLIVVNLKGGRTQVERQPPAPPSDEVVALAQKGQKIAAIKLYRKESGARLAEAKQAIESID